MFNLKPIQDKKMQAIYYQEILNHIDFIFNSMLSAYEMLSEKELYCIYYSISLIALYSLNAGLISYSQYNFIRAKVLTIL